VVLPGEKSCPSRASPLEDNSYVVFALNQVMGHCEGIEQPAVGFLGTLLGSERIKIAVFMVKPPY
jgi:hypothetical protein